MALQNAWTWDGPCFNGVLELFYSTMAVCSVIWVYIQWLIVCQEFYYGQQIPLNQQQRPNSHCWTPVHRTVLDDSRHARWDLPPSLCSVWVISTWMGCRFLHQLCWIGACFRPSQRALLSGMVWAQEVLHCPVKLAKVGLDVKSLLSECSSRAECLAVPPGCVLLHASF